MLRIFIGYDHRQPVSYTVLQHSILKRASRPVSITPLILPTLPTQRQGLTPFTFSRFLVPHLCGYEGWALFLDIDMLVLDDIAKLFDLADDRFDVMVAKNVMRFEWASLMLFNNAKCRVLTPEYVDKAAGLHQIQWSDNIGDLPMEWNHLAGYDAPRPDAKLVHFTQGVPCYPETEDSEYRREWMEVLQGCAESAPWFHLMGKSVHAKPVVERMTPDRRKELGYELVGAAQ